MESPAKIRVTAFAQVAVVTRLGWVNRDALAGIHADTGKLMAEDCRCLEDGIADATVEIGVEVATANAGRSDADENFVGAALAGNRDAFEAQIAWTVEPGGKHQAMG
jgi:hypothetical protein